MILESVHDERNLCANQGAHHGAGGRCLTGMPPEHIHEERILASLILRIRTKIGKRKWLWIVFIPFGFGRLSFNWTTGRVLFNPLSVHFQLLGAAAVKHGLYAPWIISISVPLGAIVFLIRRKRLAAAGRSPVECAENESPETQHGHPTGS